MTQALAPCPSCSRHVNTTEQHCPFCKSALGTLTAIPGTTHRLGRAAAFAFTASLAVAGCTSGVLAEGDGGTSGGHPEGSAGDGAGTKDAIAVDTGGFAPPYGVPAYGLPPTDAGRND